MTIRRLSALLTIALVALYATPAAAIPRQYHDWVWMQCAAGEPAITGHLTSVTSDGRVFGAITGCHPNILVYEAYAVAHYQSDGSAVGFASPYSSDSTAYGKVFLGHTIRAVCLIIDPATRLDCVDPFTGVHIPVDSPLVAVTAFVDMKHDGDPDGPNCPSCFD